MAQVSVRKRLNFPMYRDGQAIQGVISNNETYLISMKDGTTYVGSIQRFEKIFDEDKNIIDITIFLNPCWDETGPQFYREDDKIEYYINKINLNDIESIKHVYAKYVENREKTPIDPMYDVFTFNFTSASGKPFTTRITSADLAKVLSHPANELYPNGAPRTKATYGYVIDAYEDENGISVTEVIEIIESHGNYTLETVVIPTDEIFAIYRYKVDFIPYEERIAERNARLEARRAATESEQE